jgi:glutathione-independent formaldehyde dehydrogenase
VSGNKAVAYQGPGVVDVVDIDYPTFELKDGPGVNPANVGRKVPHGVILKTVTTNICGSDQHMVRGRTTAPTGLILGHEITGEVVEVGSDVEFVKVGDIVSVPFNIACGRCRNCKEGKTGICLNVNPDRPGSAYGYVDMGGWVGGQAEYVLVPYADWNVLTFPDRDFSDWFSWRGDRRRRRWLDSLCRWRGTGRAGRRRLSPIVGRRSGRRRRPQRKSP